ncbi:molybdopterin synthase sulfur carrier subunit [Bowmanella dokdonensis]|uniref:Molybdopterin synthase sulfur carrier subunit n=1 Tax=Bowmanella dokdonensis TaxID=751969 RepID=A0A939DRY7_9ALTE|nr:molybdopterin synthase sulfur carrier subunit [Bowmanella dokdonensis]MBN7827262.1 molybdopterin synthase sulfur carrier subunit [Bowmanella dokdonensis]
MIRVLFFAQLREVLHCHELSLAGPFNDVAALRNELMSRGEPWQEFLQPGKALVAVNQTLEEDSRELKSGDEVAFFPPVTGG